MVNEHVLIFETQPPIPFTVSESVGIEKGSMMTLSDPFTVAATGANADAICGGILAREKIAGDGEVRAGTYRGGIFRGLAGENINVGDPLTSHSVANELIVADVNDENIWGIALETATDTDTFLYELRPMVMQLT